MLRPGGKLPTAAKTTRPVLDEYTAQSVCRCLRVLVVVGGEGRNPRVYIYEEYAAHNLKKRNSTVKLCVYLSFTVYYTQRKEARAKDQKWLTLSQEDIDVNKCVFAQSSEPKG